MVGMFGTVRVCVCDDVLSVQCCMFRLEDGINTHVRLHTILVQVPCYHYSLYVISEIFVRAYTCK